MLSREDVTDPYLKAVFNLAERWDIDFKVKQKSESRLMRLLNRFVRLFSSRWMEDFHVTLGSTIYLTHTPEEAMRAQRRLVGTFLHELTHMHDRKRRGLMFTLGYAMPQLLGLLAMPLLLLPALLVFAAPGRIAAWAGAVLGLLASVALWAWWCPWVLLTAVGLLALAPWPAPWRVKWERRGYQMSMAAGYWMYDSIVWKPKDIVQFFTGFAYYRMSWDGDLILGKLEEDAKLVEHGLVEKDMWFASAHAAMIEARRHDVSG